MVEFLRQRQWVIDLRELVSNPDLYGGMSVPEPFRSPGPARVILPLWWASLTISRANQPDEPGDAVATLHYGGGARWLFSPHLGASFDLRFYQLGERPPSAASPGHPKTTQLVVTVGLSIK